MRCAALPEDVDRLVKVGAALGHALGHAQWIPGSQQDMETPRLNLRRMVPDGFDELYGCHPVMVLRRSDGT